MMYHREKYALPSKHLVVGLGARKRMVIQDSVYSSLAEHVKTFNLMIQRQTL